MGPELSVFVAEKWFPGTAHPLFSNFSLTVAPSSIVALVGPSGVGKSSLLRLIAGIDTDFRGSITVDGQPAGITRPAGFLFQDSRLLPWLTASRNITEVVADVPEQRAAALLARVGLAGSEAAFPHQLSGGMQRRVALARAVSVNPRFWLFDEPFVSLDRHLVADMQKLILEMVAAESPTAVFVTHLAEDAARLANRAIVLAGRPVQVAADLELGGNPRDRGGAEIAALMALIEQAGPSG